MGDSNSSSDEGNEGELYSSQDMSEIFCNIRDKYGHLAKEDFRNSLIDDFNEEDIDKGFMTIRSNM